MQPIDWIFVLLPLLLVLIIGIRTRRYVKSVADFMSGGRLAERYLLAVAGGEMQAGAVVFVASFEVIAKSGFTVTGWWNWIPVPVLILVAISGFVVYRFRETRAMTLSQFFEIRYSKRFRLFTGMLGFAAGICNFGIIPAVGARFMVYYLGLPPEITFGPITVPSYIPLMGLLLTATVLLALSGGIVTVMVINCVEGIMSQLFYLAIICGLLVVFKWPQINEVLLNRPPGHSFVNPFDTANTSDFNIWYVLMGLFTGVYGTLAWQNSSAYKSAALTPHESRMGGLLGRLREMGKAVVVTLLAICAIVYLQHPAFAAQSAKAHEVIHHVTDAKVREQMTIPIAVSYMLPVGVRGLLCAILLMGIFGGDSTHLHSWGSIFVQDVILPLRKKPFTPAQHITVLRLAIVGVAVFVFLFGSLFRQFEYIYMWWSVTMALYVGGAGSAIIGGLYWKKGTTAAAWVALITGSGLSAGGILAHLWYGDAFPWNGVQVSFGATLFAIAAYIGVSLWTCKADFNMDRMLHRAEGGPTISPSTNPAPQRKWSWSRLAGFDEHFTAGDKWIAGGLLAWSLLWFGVLAVGSIWNFVSPWSAAAWSTYWHITGIGIPIAISFVTGIWFTWGGVRDIGSLFRRLRAEKVNPLDDGTVIGHQNLDESPLSKTALSPENDAANPGRASDASAENILQKLPES